MSQDQVTEMPLRCKLTVEDAAELRALVELEGGDGALRWPGAANMLPGDRPVEVEVTIRASGESLVLRGKLQERSERDGFSLWVHLPDANGQITAAVGAARHFRRAPAEHLAIVACQNGSRVLCRVRDLSEGGARVVLASEDAGPEGSEVRVELLDLGLHGAELVLSGRVAWGRKAEVGVEWTCADALTKGSISRLVRGSQSPAQLAQAG